MLRRIFFEIFVFILMIGFKIFWVMNMEDLFVIFKIILFCFIKWLRSCLVFVMVFIEIFIGMEICFFMCLRICFKIDENRCKERESLLSWLMNLVLIGDLIGFFLLLLLFLLLFFIIIVLVIFVIFIFILFLMLLKKFCVFGENLLIMEEFVLWVL